MTYETQDGERVTWLEEKCEIGHPWGLGCKLCREFGANTCWARTEIRGEKQTRFFALSKHQEFETHRRAQQKLQEVHPQAEEVKALDRHDVPTFAMCYTAYHGAKAGQGFTVYQKGLSAARACGAPIPRSRQSREIAKRIVHCCAEELWDQDRKMLKECTDIALTMDARRNRLVVRMRMTLGNGMPAGLCPCGMSPGGELPGGGESAGGASPENSMEVVGVFGKYVHVADRLVSFRKMKAFETTEDLASHLTDAMREVCGGDGELWEEVKNKVRVFTPDGARDEQIAGKMAAEVYPHMMAVLRCSAHAFICALKAAWEANALAKRATKIVQEVAKYIRSSERFAARVGAKAADEVVASVENFSFAPQRFSSKERPLTRFVVFVQPLMECLALEVCIPTSSARKKWSIAILEELNGKTLTMIAMLADLSDDCSRFIRKLDEREIDPVRAALALEEFLNLLRVEYVRGDMWLRREGTFAARMQEKLQETKVAHFGKDHVVVRKPTRAEAESCQVEVANVARAIKVYLKGQFPDTSWQVLFRCFHVGGGPSPKDEQLKDLKELLGMLQFSKAFLCK